MKISDYKPDSSNYKQELPSIRRLKVYAFDPGQSMDLDNSLINVITLPIVWEPLERGPRGEYVEVIDYDPTVNKFYEPINLESPNLLATDGLKPSESTPLFHQQMVYAVAMSTIRVFEKALGRRVFWATVLQRDPDTGAVIEEIETRLRIYPHAMRQENAYYSPSKMAILFGYFPARVEKGSPYKPGSTVFTCLSHDIIAHEMTHAILDGINRHLSEPVHPDNYAFHEALADVVAMLQRFTYKELVTHQLTRTKGNLNEENLLLELAMQFGQTTGRSGSLRSAIAKKNAKGEYEYTEANPTDYETLTEPHQRGSILVSAIFDSYLTIFRRRTTDLRRMATQATISPEGLLSTDLISRLAAEAMNAANHLLNMCIRALDYCPPNEITFGDYLRALITADYDLVPDDENDYRLAIIQAFRRRGIYPSNVKYMTEEELRWDPVASEKNNPDFVKMVEKFSTSNLLSAFNIGANTAKEELKYLKAKFHEELVRFVLNDKEYTWTDNSQWLEEITGLCFSKEKAQEYYQKGEMDLSKNGLPKFEVVTLLPALRVGPGRQILNDLIIVIAQKRKINLGNGFFDFRGGATFIYDLNQNRLRYVIKRSMNNQNRLDQQLEYIRSEANFNLYSSYLHGSEEIFARLHH